MQMRSLSQPPATAKILVANPDADLRALYHNAFLGAGCDVVEAGDGHDALMKALISPPTLVLSELHLPLLDGPALCEVLRRDRTTTDVSIVIATTDTRPAELDRARQAGASAVLSRPGLEEILRESRRVMAHMRALRERAAAVSQKVGDQLDRSTQLVARSLQQRQRYDEILKNAPILSGTTPRMDQRPANHLLAALPAEDLRRLSPHLKAVSVRRKQALQRPGETIHQVYFPNDGVYSVVSVLSTGGMVEAATVGHEGVVGIEAFLSDGAVSTSETVLQVAGGEALALSVEVLRRETGAASVLAQVLGRYTQALLAQTMLSAGCMAGHTVRQRAARWLLMAHDRMHQRDFEISHESLATLLGISRPTVTQVAAALKQAGHIRYSQRRITVTSREGLALEACECYSIIRSHIDQFAVSTAPAGTSLVT